MAMAMPSMERQVRRRAGIPKKRTKARTAPEPAPSQPLPLPNLGTIRSAVAATLVMVAVAVPLVVPELSATGEPLVTEQVGASPDWLVGPPELSAQVRVTEPV